VYSRLKSSSALLQSEDRAENLVVRHHRAEALGRIEAAGLEAQPADAVGRAQLQALRPMEGQPGDDAAIALAFDQLVDETADLARVAAGLGRAFLGVVQLLDDLHRQIDVVFLELEQRGRVVHQHVGVEDVDAFAFGHHRVGDSEIGIGSWRSVIRNRLLQRARLGMPVRRGGS
jgi:hypothetical protein